MKNYTLAIGIAVFALVPLSSQSAFADKTQTCTYVDDPTTCEPTVEIGPSESATYAAKCTDGAYVYTNNELNVPAGVACSMTNDKNKFHCTNWNTKQEHFTQRIQCAKNN